MDNGEPLPQHVSRRHILQILTALGIAGAAAEQLAASAAPTVSPDALRGAADLLSGRFDEARLRVAQAAVQRNLDQLQAVRDLELPDRLEPATVFQVRRA
jgi:hypothetical protein